MKVFVDADACPVVDITVNLCKEHGFPCILMCDTAHTICKEGSETLIFDKGADSVDFALVNRLSPGDIVITQDYGLASMCMAKQARILHQDGWEYTPYNISGLMEQRHAAKKFRAAGGRIKGPAKRTPAQNAAFAQAFEALLQNCIQG